MFRKPRENDDKKKVPGINEVIMKIIQKNKYWIIFTITRLNDRTRYLDLNKSRSNKSRLNE